MHTIWSDVRIHSTSGTILKPMNCVNTEKYDKEKTVGNVDITVELLQDDIYRQYEYHLNDR